MSTLTLSPLSLDRQQAKAIVTALGVLLVTTQIQPIWRTASSIVGRLYLNMVIMTNAVTDKKHENETDKENLQVSGLFIHPVKSFRPVSLDNAQLDKRGFINDRRFMLIVPLPKSQFSKNEPTHRFLSQRQCPSLATVEATFSADDRKLKLEWDQQPGGNTNNNSYKSITIPTEPAATAKRYMASLWGDMVQVVDMGDAAAAFCQTIVDQDSTLPDEMKGDGIRLVVQAPHDTRDTSATYTPASAHSWWGTRPSVALTDGFPLLLANQASLDELNRRLSAKGKAPIPMSRFRPNIVVQGGEDTQPFDEDTWKVVEIDGVLFHIVKGCPRCKQSCTDQRTGQITEEPLETLAEFRATTAVPEDVYFAQNVIAAQGSAGRKIRVGSKVRIIQRGSPVWET